MSFFKSRSPFVWALLAGLLVLLVAFVPVLFGMWRPPAATSPAAGLPPPWQIVEGPGDSVQALGLQLPGATLADAVARWGDDLQVAVIRSDSRPAALEAYTDRWNGGGVAGKLVLATDVPAADLERWRAELPQRDAFDASQATRWPLRPEARAEALRSAVVGLSFVPASRLQADTLRERFGAPDEEVSAADGSRHWLYPARGLAIVRDEASGKVVLQVVAPADFERRLRAPLLK